MQSWLSAASGAFTVSVSEIRLDFTRSDPGRRLAQAGTAEIEQAFEESLREVELLVPYSDGARLSELYELAGELEREESPEGVRVRAKIPAGLAHRFAEFSVNGAGSSSA